MVDELKEQFNKLSDKEKTEFLRSVMPTLCEIFMKSPEKMMSEMMPMCGEMMKSRNMDMQGMMNMMGMMGKQKA